MSAPEISGMNELQYYVFFSDFRTAFLDRAVEEAARSGRLTCAKEAGRSVGFLCAVDEKDHFRVTGVFTLPPYRGRGILTALLRDLIRAGGKPVRVSISGSHPFAGPVRKACEGLGLYRGEPVRVFSCPRETDEPWRRFMERKGRRLCDTLERQGYRTVSFAGADRDLLRQLAFSPRPPYENRFHPAVYLEDPARGLSREMSFAAVRNGSLAAYSLVRKEAEKAAVFEQISVSARERGRGVILLPFAASMDAFFRSDCTRALYAMYDSDSAALAFRNKVLRFFLTQESLLENYYTFRNGGEQP